LCVEAAYIYQLDWIRSYGFWKSLSKTKHISVYVGNALSLCVVLQPVCETWTTRDGRYSVVAYSSRCRERRSCSNNQILSSGSRKVFVTCPDVTCSARKSWLKMVNSSLITLLSHTYITVSATGVLRMPDHVCGTRCQSIYGTVTLSDSLNGC